MADVQQATDPAPAAGEQCSQCGAALATGQRYCLNCGTRHGPPRTAPELPAAAPAAGTERVEVRSEPRQSDFSPLAAVLGIALLGGMLLIGVLIGRGESDDDQTPAVVQLEEATTPTKQPGSTEQPNPPAGGQGASQAPAEIVSEWPAGTEGFTVRLTSTPKQGATAEAVESLQADAESKGVSTVGVLDSDLYASLPAGEWIIYSGVYAERGDAEKAVSDVRGDYPGASAVEVSTTQPGSTQQKLEPSQGGTVAPPAVTGAQPPESARDQALSSGGG